MEKNQWKIVDSVSNSLMMHSKKLTTLRKYCVPENAGVLFGKEQWLCWVRWYVSAMVKIMGCQWSCTSVNRNVFISACFSEMKRIPWVKAGPRPGMPFVGRGRRSDHYRLFQAGNRMKPDTGGIVWSACCGSVHSCSAPMIEWWIWRHSAFARDLPGYLHYHAVYLSAARRSRKWLLS